MTAGTAETSRALLTLMKEPVIPEPGVHPHVSFAEYHAWEAASNSRLSVLRRSPAHLKAYLEHGNDSDTLMIGRACHSAILEPDDFTKRYLRSERCEGVTKSKERCKNPGTSYRGAEGWTCGVHGNGVSDPGIVILTPGDYDCAIRVRDSVHAHRAGALLKAKGTREESLVWRDPETGVLCKARPDHYAPELLRGVLADVKTTRDASKDAFERAIHTYGYHRQAAFYLQGNRAVERAAEDFLFIAVEKEPPYGVALYLLSEGALSTGDIEIRQLLARYAECVERDEWPCYPQDVQDIALPAWAYNQVEEIA